MEQKEPIIVLYDREEEYARLFSEYLKRQKELPWEIHTYTGIEELLDSEKTGEVTMLVVAESSYADRLETLQPVCQAILNESGTLRWHQFPNINKYQEAEGVWKELLELYVEAVGVRLPLLCAEYKTKFIGIYSPVHRCLQSSFALTFAQLIAEKHPALYLNFEHYIGIMELLPERQNRDLADLLYFLAGDPDKFSLRMQTVIQKKGNLDYIPPMRNGQNLLEITLESCPKAIFIPAHIWTPHFSMFGAFSNFSSVEECFEDLTPYIHAMETGLSSDPPMNWRVSRLDRYQLVSNSDAHSPAKLGREANLLDTELSYSGLYYAIQEGTGLAGTIEFFPEEGKYHYDGHRSCNLCLKPAEAIACGGICPVCGKKLGHMKAWSRSLKSLPRLRGCRKAAKKQPRSMRNCSVSWEMNLISCGKSRQMRSNWPQGLVLRRESAACGPERWSAPRDMTENTVRSVC